MKALEKKRGRVWPVLAVLVLLAALAAVRIPGNGGSICSITDGNRVLVHTTNEKDPEKILKDQGIVLGVDDSYTQTEEHGIREIRIIRGKKRNQVISRRETYCVVVQPEEIRCADPTIPAGLEVVVREGSCGELQRTAQVTYTNGVETGRQVLEEKVRIRPVSRVIAVGIGAEEGAQGELVIQNGLIYLPTGEVLTYDRVITSLATAYCDKGLTATGTQARVGAIAVDPKVIPYGTRMFIVSKDGEYVYGLATAEDCGSTEHIYDTRIDLHFDTYAECRAFGARYCRVYFLS